MTEAGDKREVMLDVTTHLFVDNERQVGAQAMYIKEDGVIKLLDHIRYQGTGEQ